MKRGGARAHLEEHAQALINTCQARNKGELHMRAALHLADSVPSRSMALRLVVRRVERCLGVGLPNTRASFMKGEGEDARERGLAPPPVARRLVYGQHAEIACDNQRA